MLWLLEDYFIYLPALAAKAAVSYLSNLTWFELMMLGRLS